jgi:hypothetical protein
MTEITIKDRLKKAQDLVNDARIELCKAINMSVGNLTGELLDVDKYLFSIYRSFKYYVRLFEDE